ncbi:MAG: Ig-like domain-containing protein [Patescibacteria group bacterium]|nr:Ig-like domain-containing protein [Patescibacteria group bacterium]
MVFKFRKNLIVIVLLIMAGFAVANFALAQGADVGLEYGEQIGLSSEDPRVIAANVIRIALGFLGIIAVGLIIYAGWLYMTAAGEEDKIEKAKKILTGAVIGLIIILSAFAIASFVLNRLLIATGPGAGTEEPGGGGPGGPGITPGDGDGDEVISCDQTAGGVCDADATLCPEGFYCETDSCACQAGGGFGESCDSMAGPDTCEADNNLCSAYLACDTGTCTCLGAPVIERVSPADGAAGSLVTISGRYFGTSTPGQVYFADPTGTPTVPASFPNSNNPNCDNNWKDNQIIVIVPEGAMTGPIRVVAADSRSDTTDNDRGPNLDDFVVNDIVRPGLCKITPAEGIMDNSVTYYGLGLSGGTAFYGDEEDRVIAQGSVFNTDKQGAAKVPNIQTGETTTFVLNKGIASNYLEFTKNKEPYIGPAITSFEPTGGPGGQYVTIYGRGFGRIRGATNHVYFKAATQMEANYQFPEICAETVWSDNQIIVKVPEGMANGDYTISMEISGQTINSESLFKVNNGLPPVPSLCKIDPTMGPNNTPINLWGENFGDQATGLVRFSSNKDQAGAAISFWGDEDEAQKITTTVHQQAITGPVKIAQNGLAGNGLNFKVGSCAKDTDCGSQVCCPANSSEAGRCKASKEECYVRVVSSVYEWEFSTGSFSGNCAPGQIVCGSSCCNSGVNCLNPASSTCANINCASPRITCGDNCCAVGVTACVGGRCPISQCSGDQTVCGSSCCNPGSNCLDTKTGSCENVVCSAPRVTCGGECCVSGITACVGGKCPIASRPGERCVATTAPQLVCNSAFNCGADYSCRNTETDTCGTCCCDPTIPQINTNGLQCVADKSPCDGASRGLYCGCEEDQDCGSVDRVGCASDTCCRERPEISVTYPADNTAGVCLNSLISATFNEKMDIASFPGNVIVAGDYENSVCPAGTQYLALGEVINKKRNVAANFYQKISSILAKAARPLFGGKVLAGPPDPNHNYCALTGIVSGINKADGKTDLTFSLNKILDKNRTYYVVIKGDEDLNSDKGVLSAQKIGMNGPDTATFGGQTFTRAKIWSFTTGNNVCQLDNITINPASYLFKTAGEPQSFQAEPRSANGQVITAIPGSYNWEWDWSSVNSRVAETSNSNNPIQAVTAKNVKDGKTFIKAIATITEDTVSKTSTVGQTKTGQAEVYVFLCENPWPPIKADGTWETWKDSSQGMSCLSNTGECANTNYEFYYCRDKGAVGSVDDLPAILSEDTIIRGKSNIQGILKEAYFFRETLPDVSEVNLNVVGIPIEGGIVSLSWSPILAPADEELAGYIVYYGTNSGRYAENIDAGMATSFTVDNLNNNQTYYFSIVAEYASGAVSGYSNEVSATPRDTEALEAPVITSIAPGNRRAIINWVDASGEAVNFRVYYKATSDCGAETNFGSSQAAKDSPATILNLSNGVEYCFGLVAYDAENNASEKAIDSAIPFTAPANLSARAGDMQIDLTWEAAAGAAGYKVYRGEASGSYSTSITEDGTSHSFVGSLVNGTTYYFAVKSVNADGSESAYSNEVSATPRAVTP